MKKIGILGGMTFESSVNYYYRINREINKKVGGSTCAEMLLYNLNFGPIADNMEIQNWEPIFNILLDAAKKVESIGADFLVIATNTMHRFYDRLQIELKIPILHIADCVARKCDEQNVHKVLLLGSYYTMTQDFLKNRLVSHGLEVVSPTSEEDLREIHRVIMYELGFGNILDSSHQKYVDIINKAILEEGIKGVILGCTEIELLIKPGDVSIPVLDTTQAHIDGAVNYIIGNWQ